MYPRGLKGDSDTVQGKHLVFPAYAGVENVPINVSSEHPSVPRVVYAGVKGNP